MAKMYTQQEYEVELLKQRLADGLGSISEMRTENQEFRKEMRAEYQHFRGEMREDNKRFRTEMRIENQEFREEIRFELHKLGRWVFGLYGMILTAAVAILFKV